MEFLVNKNVNTPLYPSGKNKNFSRSSKKIPPLTSLWNIRDRFFELRNQKILKLNRLFYFITPSLLLGIRLKSAHEIERTGMTNVWNWTNVDDWPRGIEIGCFFGLFTTRIRRFSSPFLKIAFLSSYTSKNRHFSGSIFGRSGRVGPVRAGSLFAQNVKKIAFRFEPKALIKPSIYQILKWSNKPSKVHFSIWFQSAFFNLICRQFFIC